MSTFQNIKDRIEVLSKFLGKSVAELEKGDKKDFPGEDDRLLGNATISGWYSKKTDWTSATLDKFLNYYRINREWWKTGEGDIILTPVPESTSSKEKTPEEIYRDLVECRTDYRLVPKIILNEEYRIVLKSEIDSRDKILEIALSKSEQLNATMQVVIDAKNLLIAEYEKTISELRAKVAAVSVKAVKQ